MIKGSDGRRYGYTTQLLPRSNKMDVEVFIHVDSQRLEYLFTFVSDDLDVKATQVKKEIEEFLGC